MLLQFTLGVPLQIPKVNAENVLLDSRRSLPLFSPDLVVVFTRAKNKLLPFSNKASLVDVLPEPAEKADLPFSCGEYALCGLRYPSM